MQLIGYRPEFFELYEMLPRDFYAAWYPVRAENLWSIFDPILLAAADGLRARYGPMVINTWFWGGPNQYRGYRPPACAIGAPLSMHRFGRALDLVPTRTTAEAIRAEIRRHPSDPVFQRVSRVENNVDWLHIDRANVPGSLTTRFFNP